MHVAQMVLNVSSIFIGRFTVESGLKVIATLQDQDIKERDFSINFFACN